MDAWTQAVINFGLYVCLAAIVVGVQIGVIVWFRHDVREVERHLAEQIAGLTEAVQDLNRKVSALTRKVEDESHAAMEALDLVRKLERYGDGAGRKD